jgi:dipeptidyl aminopeptidase/acylaminoacyl peptidase
MMTMRRRILLVAVLLSLTSCAQEKRQAPAKSRVESQTVSWNSIDSGRYRLSFASLGPLQNAGLQLPRASPDGRWIATIESGKAASLDPDAAITGETIAETNLIVRDLRAPNAASHAVAAAAAWPVWSGDSRQFIAVSYDKSGRCGLIIHEIASGQTRRLNPGAPGHIITPAISPDGKRLAFAAFDQTPQHARLYVFDLQKQQLGALAAPKDCVWQLSPMWVNGRALMCYARVGEQTGLLGIALGDPPQNSWLTSMALPADAVGVLRTQSGILAPLSDDGRWLASFDSAENRIVLRDLEKRITQPLEYSSQSGLWAGSHFIYTTDKKLFAYNTAGGVHLLASKPFLPRWCDEDGSSLLLAARGAQEWTFELVRMQIASAQ